MLRECFIETIFATNLDFSLLFGLNLCVCGRNSEVLSSEVVLACTVHHAAQNGPNFRVCG